MEFTSNNEIRSDSTNVVYVRSNPIEIFDPNDNNALYYHFDGYLEEYGRANIALKATDVTPTKPMQYDVFEPSASVLIGYAVIARLTPSSRSTRHLVFYDAVI